MQFLLDTNTCIRLLRGDQKVQHNLARHKPTDCAISVIASYELYTAMLSAVFFAGDFAWQWRRWR